MGRHDGAAARIAGDVLSRNGAAAASLAKDFAVRFHELVLGHVELHHRDAPAVRADHHLHIQDALEEAN